MKAIVKMIAVLAAFMLVSNSPPAIAAGTVSLPAYSPAGDPVNLPEMKLSEFVKLSAKEFYAITGIKMNLKERVSFSLLKRQMKKSLRAHPDQTLKEYLATADKKENKTQLIVLIALAVIIITVIIINAINSMDFGISYPTGEG